MDHSYAVSCYIFTKSQYRSACKTSRRMQNCCYMTSVIPTWNIVIAYTYNEISISYDAIHHDGPSSFFISFFFSLVPKRTSWLIFQIKTKNQIETHQPILNYVQEIVGWMQMHSKFKKVQTYFNLRRVSFCYFLWRKNEKKKIFKWNSRVFLELLFEKESPKKMVWHILGRQRINFN